MAIQKAKKAEILKDLSEKFKKAKTVVWTHYQGIDVNSMVKMRKQLHAAGIDFRVAKKTLIKKAAESAGLKEIPHEFDDGPIGVAFSYQDEIAPAKLLFKFGKENPKIELIGAWMDGKFMLKQEAVELAKIPGREELLAKFVYLCNYPISGFVNVLAGPMRGLLNVLQALQKGRK